MTILNALIPALLAGFLCIIFGAIIRMFYPPYDWTTIFSMAAGVTVGNFIMYLFFNNFNY